MTVKISNVTGNDLHCQYTGQTSPQPCHVELDAREEGVLSAAYNPEIGNAVPQSVHAGHVLRWSIPALRSTAVNELLAKIAPFAQRIVDGYDEVLDGRNWIADFDDDANKACDEIEALCDNVRAYAEAALTVYQAVEWYGYPSTTAAAELRAELGITAESTDGQLEEIAKRELLSAQLDGCDVIEGLDAYLEQMRKTLQVEAEDAAE